MASKTFEISVKKDPPEVVCPTHEVILTNDAENVAVFAYAMNYLLAEVHEALQSIYSQRQLPYPFQVEPAGDETAEEKRQKFLRIDPNTGISLFERSNDTGRSIDVPREGRALVETTYHKPQAGGDEGRPKIVEVNIPLTCLESAFLSLRTRLAHMRAGNLLEDLVKSSTSSDNKLLDLLFSPSYLQ